MTGSCLKEPTVDWEPGWLVLTRRLDEEIVIDVPASVPATIRIRVVQLGEGKVRIALKAPLTYSIMRSELLTRA